MSKGKWTFKKQSNEDKDKIVIAFSPELEEMINKLFTEIFGIQFLSGSKRITEDGLIEISFKADENDRKAMQEALNQTYWQRYKLSTDN